MRRPLTVALLVALLGVADTARAATVGVPEGGIDPSYHDSDGVANEVTVRREGDEFVFTDALVPLTVTAPCTPVGTNTARCPARKFITLSGGGGDDKITVQGTLLPPDGQAFIMGGEGDDTLTGGGDRDTIMGYDGVDHVFGGDGQDQIDGGRGDDFLEGQGGHDSFFGGDGEAVLPLGESGGGNDVIRGGDDSDSISYYGAGGVRVTLDDGADDGHAGEKDDVAEVESVNGTEGPDVLIAPPTGAFLVGRQGDDTLQGGAGADSLQGGDGVDTLLGADGDDRLDGGLGADWLDCGGGRDMVENHWTDDQIDVSCEDNFGRPWGTPDPPPTVLPPRKPPAATPPPVSRVGATATAALRRKRMTLKVTCTGTGACAGTLTVKAGRRRLGSAAYSLAGGASQTVEVALGASARRALKGRRRVTATVAGISQPRSLKITVRR